MRPKTLVVCVALAVITAIYAPTSRADLKVGDQAPPFRLMGTDDKEYTLEQFQGKSALALVWFLRAGSGGSRTQLCAIRDKLEEIRKYNVQVLGITTSTLQECKDFAQELGLTYPLVSDPDAAVATAYGALRGGTGPTCERWVFLIDDQGVIRNIEKSEAVADKANLLLQALAAGTLTAPAPVTPPTRPVTSSAVVAEGRRYTIYDYNDPATKSFAVVIPEGLQIVRGLLVECNHAGGDSRGDWKAAYYREFLHWHGFAFVGSKGDIPHAKAFQAFRDCLEKVAVASQHPELVNAPYVAVGFSAGGGFASTLMTYDPNRTIAVGIYGARYNFDVFTRPGGPAGPTATHRAIPSILITGEQEKLNAPDVDGRRKVDEVFVPNRPLGGQFAWIERQGIGHQYDENRPDVVAMPLLDFAVRTRYPQHGDVTQSPVTLINIDSSTGWLADNTTWKSGLTKVVPAGQFRGDLGHSSWLQNEDLAFIYRAYATYDKPLTITTPGPCDPSMPAVDPGVSVPIVVDAGKFPNWRKLEFFDGATKLGEVTQEPTRLTATNLTPGYHVFSVLGTDDQGTVRTSDPRMVIVRKLPEGAAPPGA